MRVPIREFAGAASGSGHPHISFLPPSIHVPQARNCYCTPAYWGAAVDCATCRCSACVRPSVAHQEDDDCTPQTIAEQPFYLNRAGACQR